MTTSGRQPNFAALNREGATYIRQGDHLQTNFHASPAVPENTIHLFLMLLLITTLHKHSITNHHPICRWCFCIVYFLYFSLYCLIVLFGLTTTKLNKLYYYFDYEGVQDAGDVAGTQEPDRQDQRQECLSALVDRQHR